MVYVVIDLKEEKIIKLTDYQAYQDELEALGSHSDADYYHIQGLNELSFRNLLHLMLSSKESTYLNFQLITK